MRRNLLSFFACSLVASIAAVACTQETIIVKKAPGTDTPAQATTEQPPEETPDAAPAVPVPTDPQVVDLGDVTTGVDVTFDIPQGALGFNIVAESEVADFDPERPFGIQRITDPKGNVVHDDFTPEGGTKPTSTAAFDVLASASVPQGDGVPELLPVGKWKVRFGMYGGSATAKVPLKAKVRVQSSGDGVFHGGVLDLKVHVPAGLRVGGTSVDPAKASTNAAIKQRLDTFFALTSQLLGIERGTVTFQPAKSTLADLDDEEIIEGFATSVGETDGTPMLHVLFTNSIRSGGENIALGIAPGIPGAANVFGRGVSGIIVATSQGADEDVLTMIHEAGHFIGLNHTTEFDGQSSDPLSDTPRCSTIANRQLLSCADRNNVMFAAGAIDNPVMLSPTQKRVYRGSPVYKALSPAAMKTRSQQATTTALPVLQRHFRASGKALSPLESELSLGFCGLNKLDAKGMVSRYGQVTLAELRAAAADQDLAPVIRGRAKLALQQLGAQP